MAADERELAYYRAVEDLFAALRGVPHVLSPRDFHLLRSWWRDEVPLAVIRTAVTEVLGKRRERGETEPVVSLSYCRHAVARHARRVAEMQVGAPRSDGFETPDPGELLAALAGGLDEVGDRLAAGMPRVAAAIRRLAPEVRAAAELPPQLVEEHLYALETTLLDRCLEALTDDERRDLEAWARRQAESMTDDPDARERTFRALRDRRLREKLQLPRLEI